MLAPQRPAHVEKFRDEESRDEAAAAFIAVYLYQGLNTRGAATLIATGGRTPRRLYALLSQARLDWRRVAVTLSDERQVPVDAPASNEGMLRAHLLRAEASAAGFVALMGPEETPQAIAAAACRRLAGIAWPTDLTLLGMGEDGHIASLFPGNPALAQGLAAEAPRCIAVPARAPAPQEARLSLSLQALLDTRAVLIVAGGGAKRAVFETACFDTGSALPLAVLLRRCTSPVHFFWSP